MTPAFSGVLPDGVTVTRSVRRYARAWRRAGRQVAALLEASGAGKWAATGFEPGMTLTRLDGRGSISFEQPVLTAMVYAAWALAIDGRRARRTRRKA